MADNLIPAKKSAIKRWQIRRSLVANFGGQATTDPIFFYLLSREVEPGTFGNGTYSLFFRLVFVLCLLVYLRL